ncbi:XRE family transcriptional regulator, partial [Clostridium perfringens]|nr:XRE family transcriptional regulator [Clostridium perfringens]
MLNIGDKIKAIRKERGLTQKEFAKKINKSERMIQKYENSEVEPRIEVLREIATALDISFSELINPKNSSINIS